MLSSPLPEGKNFRTSCTVPVLWITRGLRLLRYHLKNMCLLHPSRESCVTGRWSFQLCTKSRGTRLLNQPCGDVAKPSQAASPVEFMDIILVQTLLLAMIKTCCIRGRWVNQCSVYLVHKELSTSLCWTESHKIIFALSPANIVLHPEKLDPPSLTMRNCRCF